jgi:hypothetical protein
MPTILCLIIACRPCGGTGHRKRAVALKRKLLHLLRENRLCVVCTQGVAQACQLWVVVDLGLLGAHQEKKFRLVHTNKG